ncbi:hypothetical protein [Streptomyces sp. NPDC059575]|uniref:hypothetical protein n=1 Tax=Streptomyces sp. NPDC059575 TaxID=3346872 RepID=UPI003680A970
MDLAGIGALVAAGAALIGVAVNHKQVKAAIRNAEATYRAAIDGAREQGLNEHRQWRRTMRREAYATLLQAVLSFNDHAEKLLTQGFQDARLVLNLVAEAKPLAKDMTRKEFVVRLEGPEEVSTATRALIDAASAVMGVCRTEAMSEHVRLLIADQADAHPQEVERVRYITATYRVEGYWSLIGTEAMPREAGAMLAELRGLLDRIGVSRGFMPALCTRQSPTAYGDAAEALSDAITSFMATARAALDEET